MRKVSEVVKYIGIYNTVEDLFTEDIVQVNEELYLVKSKDGSGTIANNNK